MTTYTWTGSHPADWGSAGDWAPAGGPPGSADTAIILAGGTVGVSFAQSIDVLDVAAGAMLLVAEGVSFSVRGALASAGAILDAGTLVVAGTVVTLDSGGGLALNGTSDSSAIVAAASGEVLVNVDNTIAGGGSLGGGAMGLTNEAGGVIDAVASFTASATLTVAAAGTLANAGLIETTTGSLVLAGPVDNTGTIAAMGAVLTLDGGTNSTGVIEVTKGTLTVAGFFENSGTVMATRGTLVVSGEASNSGLIDVATRGTLILTGEASNSGLVDVATDGTLIVTGGAGNSGSIDVASGTLDIQGTIDNTGMIETTRGNGDTSAINVQGVLDNSTGTIVISGSSAFDVFGTIDNGGTIDAVTGLLNVHGTADNAGTIESGGGGFDLAGTVTNTGLIAGALVNGFVNNAGGTLDGIDLAGAVVSGGRLVGSLRATGGTLDGSTSPIVGSGSGGVGSAAIAVEGPISILGTLDAIQFSVAALQTLTFTGPGVTLGGGAGIQLVSAYYHGTGYHIARLAAEANNDVLTNIDGTIDGAGTITGQIVNGEKGVIAADAGTIGSFGNELNLIGTVTNAGLIESVTQYFNIRGAINQLSGGTISSTGMSNGVGIYGTVTGGTLTGQIRVVGTLDGSTSPITNIGTIGVGSPGVVVLGTVVNQGKLDGGFVIASPTVTLTGAGLVEANLGTISATSQGDTLVNVNNTIQGPGDIGGSGMLALLNESAGLIEATTGTLVIDAPTFTNTGTLAANSGLLSIVTGTFTDLTATWIADNGTIALPNPNGFAGIAGNVTLAGTGADFVASTGTNAQVQSLTNSYLAPQTIIAGGTLAVLNGATFGIDRTPGSTLLPFGNAGLLLLGGGTANLTASVSNDGRILGFGALSAAGATMNNSGGTIEATGGLLSFAGVLSGGLLAVDAGATLDLASDWYGGGGAVSTTFGAANGLLRVNVIDTLGTFSSVGSLAVDGFVAGDTIEIAGTVAGGIFPGVTVNDDGHTLDIIGGGQTIGALGFVGGTAHLVLSQDDNNNEFITAACFAAGTRILTARGEVAVEALRIGEMLPTLLDGRGGAVRWLGHRRVDCRSHPRPREVWPIRVRAGAFAAGVPRRDLWLSPDHAVLVDHVLIPVRYLVNGASIAQVEVAEVAYWHVELDRHEVILAEWLPAESYLDTGNRSAFADDGAIAVSLA